MSRKRTIRLGDLQLRIMQVLWAHDGPMSVADVQTLLDGERLAYTTVATMLRKMESRELVRHNEEGRKFVYEAAITPEQVSRGLVDDLVDRLFAGNLANAVSHLLESRAVDQKELGQLERLIKQHKHLDKRDK